MSWLATALAIAWFAALYVQQAGLVSRFRFDDSFITLRYARQLVHHGTLSFNPDERIDGYTSPAWTLILAACEALGIDGAESMTTLSRVLGLVAVVLGFAFARALGARWWFAVAVAGLGALYTPGFVVWSMPGMEMPLAACAYTALLWSFVWRPRRAVRRAATLRAALLFVTALVRPEGALLAGMLWSYDVITTWTEHAGAPRAWFAAVRAHLVVAVALGTLFLWRWSYYGYPLPNTFYAKSSTPALVVIGVADAMSFLAQRGLWLAPLAALVLAESSMKPRERAALAAFALWFGCVLTVYARSGGDFPGFHRFYQPLVPASFAVLAALMSNRAASLHRARRAFGIVAAVACGAYFVMCDAHVLRDAFAQDAGRIRSQTEAVDQWERAGLALRDAIPRPARVVVRAAGVLPLRARAEHVFDTVALNNPEVAHHNEAIHDVPAHQKEATEEQILGWRPNVIVGHPDIERTDRTDHPPGWMESPTYRRLGYRFRCVPMVPTDYICFWQLG